jgi:hypothetical protein
MRKLEVKMAGLVWARIVADPIRIAFLFVSQLSKMGIVSQLSKRHLKSLPTASFLAIKELHTWSQTSAKL